MKKSLSLIGILLLSSILIACHDVSDDEVEETLSVEWNAAAKHVIISVPNLNGAEYINIFRKNSDDDEYNIGEIIPKKTSRISFIFYDELAANTKDGYTYRARYRLNDNYKYTSWSKAVIVSDSDFASEPSPVLAQSGTKEVILNYKTETSNLVLENGSIDIQPELLSAAEGGTCTQDFAGDYAVVLALKTESDAILVGMGTEKGKSVNEGKERPMVSILPLEYLEKELSVIGVLYQRVEPIYVDDDEEEGIEYTTVHWSTKTKIGLMVDDETAKNFTVKRPGTDESSYSYTVPVESERAVLALDF